MFHPALVRTTKFQSKWSIGVDHCSLRSQALLPRVYHGSFICFLIWQCNPHSLKDNFLGVHGGSRRLTPPQPKSVQGLDLGPLHICGRLAACLPCGSSNSWSGGCLNHLPALDLLPLTRLPGWDSLGEAMLRPMATGCPRVGRYPRGTFPCLRRRGRICGGGTWKRGGTAALIGKWMNELIN